MVQIRARPPAALSKCENLLGSRYSATTSTDLRSWATQRRLTGRGRSWLGRTSAPGVSVVLKRPPHHTRVLPGLPSFVWTALGLTLQQLELENHFMHLTGPVAQWIRLRPTEPGIAGSSPAGVMHK